jgi:hypothetical protein
MVSRPIPLRNGDELVVRVLGRGADTAVNVVTSLRDRTAARVNELVGSGPTAVDHDHGGTDALAVVSSAGARLAGATIRAYRAADYAAGNRTAAFVVGETDTDVTAGGGCR